MNRKIIASGLTAAMVASLLAGCGSSSTASSGSTSAASSAASASAASSAETASSTSAASESTSAAASSETASAPVAGSDDMTAGTQFEGTTANSAYNFSMMVKSFQSTYWQAAVQGMEQAGDELGVTYDAQGPNSESDIADQVNMLNTAISSSPDGIGLAACDTTSVLDSLQNAKDAGIPVVCFDTGVNDAPEGSVLSTIATDNLAAGALAADKMYDALKDVIANADSQVRIGEVNQDATAQNIQQRGLGFINEMISLIQADGKTVSVEGNEFYVNAAEGADTGDTDVVIEVAVPAQTTVELSSTEAQTILSKEDTIGIFGSNQVTAEGVLSANSNLSVLGSEAGTDVIGVGFDAGSTQKAAVMDGTFIGSVTQSPLMMGYYAIYALTKIANGDTVEDMPMPGYWYDATNIDDPTIAPNLYD